MAQFLEFAGNHSPLFLAFMVVLSLFIWTFIQAKLQKFLHIPPMEAVNLINREDALILDIREHNEYNNEGHIVNAKHIPLSSLAQHINTLNKDKQRPIVVTCRSGSRSASACATLQKCGFEKLYNMKGGIIAWQNADLPVTKK